MIVQHAELIEMLHRADKIDFAKSQWEEQEDGSWRKVVYTRSLCTSTDEYTTDWVEHRILKDGVSDKEYFKRKLSGNI